MSIEIIRQGRRSYFQNLPFALKDAVKAEGARWDSAAKMWWMGNDEKARRVAAELNAGPAPKEQATGRYAKLDDGTWGVRGRNLVEGEEVTVFKRSGDRKVETVGTILSTDADGWQTATLRRQGRASRSASQGYSYSYSRSRYGRRYNDGWTEACGYPCPVDGHICTPDDPCHDCI